MMNADKGHPRLGVIDATATTMSISNVISLDDASMYWRFGNMHSTIDSCTIVYPRIKISSLSLKADSANINITYNDTELEDYKDYYILTRSTNREGISCPEYFITLKPETLM